MDSTSGGMSSSPGKCARIVLDGLASRGLDDKAILVWKNGKKGKILRGLRLGQGLRRLARGEKKLGSAPRLLMCQGVMRRKGKSLSIFLFPASVNLAGQNQLIEYAQSMRSR